MKFEIRKARLQDIDTIIELCAAHAAYEQCDYDSVGKTKKLASMLFCDIPQLYSLLAEVDGQIIGYATFSLECSTWQASYYVHMDCLFFADMALARHW
jgi:hypothetical protein